ncbi:ribose-5-phosphate isomerase RpiA [Bacillaceae bacterium Marseille-Q3522]|nr:ribose-5-phosphate isomerase RpiA [Bacillaceae bacterium Marseille-Q3522]
MKNINDLKKKHAAEKVIDYIADGKVLGLGSGSTMYWVMKRLGESVQQGLHVKGIPSSRRTEGWANEFGVPLTDFSTIQKLDLAIDGADEVDPHFHLTKGGGGSLVREKLVAAAARQFIVVADESKIVPVLGNFPLPVEVVPFGWETTAERISQLGCKPKLRKKNNNVFISDNGNYILDCPFTKITNPESLHTQLKQLLGVVETGLFTGMADIVIIGKEDGTEIMVKKQ